MNIHVLFGEEAFLLNQHKNSIIKDVNSFSISVQDMRETALDTVLEDARTIDMFGEGKTIILQNSTFLTTEKPGKITHNLDALINYLAAPNPLTTLIFIVNNGKLDKRKKVVKSLLKVAKSYEGKPLRNVHSFIKQEVKAHGKSLSAEACDFIQNRLGTNLFLIHNEIEKVCLYCDDVDVIEIPMLDKVLSRTLEDDVFKLIERTVQKMPSALEILDDLFRLGQEPIKIIILIANQFRTLHQVKALQDMGEKPAAVLNIHPYRLQIVEEQAELYSLVELQEKLDTLAKLDLKMKRGQVKPQIAVETLILKWIS